MSQRWWNQWNWRGGWVGSQVWDFVPNTNSFLRLSKHQMHECYYSPTCFILYCLCKCLRPLPKNASAKGANAVFSSFHQNLSDRNKEPLYHSTTLLLFCWLGGWCNNYLMPNMRSPLLRKEILVLGSACQTSSPVPLEEPWQLLVRVSQIHELVSSLELSWFIKGFASLNTDCWFLGNKNLG